MGGKKKILDRAHYHVDNGGITFKFVETTHERESKILSDTEWEETPNDSLRMRKVLGTETRVNRRYYAEIQTTHYGSGVTFRFPLGNPNIISYLITCLGKIQHSMLEDRDEPTDGYEFAYRDNNPLGVTHCDGKEVEDAYWPQNAKRTESEGFAMLCDASEDSSDVRSDLLRKAEDCVKLVEKENPKARGKRVEDLALKLMGLPWDEVKKRLSES